MLTTNRIILMFVCHLLSWNRSSCLLSDPTNNTLSLPNNSSSGFNFAEGGTIKISVPANSVPTSVPFTKAQNDSTSLDLLSDGQSSTPHGTPGMASSSPHGAPEMVSSSHGAPGMASSTPHGTPGMALSSPLDLLSNGAPGVGTSSVKARKGVDIPSVVPRKGAPPCDSNNSTKAVVDCPPSSSSNKSEDLPSVSKEPLEQKTVKPPHKPSLTIVPADSDKILKSLKNDRNVVIPVIGLVCTPLLVVLLLFVYKSCQQSRGSGDYQRMGFLIEDIYND